MAFLPRFLVLEHGGRYLSVAENVPPTTLPSGFLRFNEPQIWSPRVKFEVETGDGRLAHIRSCYNNKYLVAERFQNELWIAASADKPDEDRSKESCTLFEPWSVSQGVNLVHFQTGIIVRVWNTAGNTNLGVAVRSSGGSVASSLFRTTDWEQLVVLPSQVTFRSQELDDNYLCSRSLKDIDGYTYHRFHMFESDLDVGDPLVAYQLFPTPNGNYRIKSLHFGTFWRQGPNWILADAEASNNSTDTTFSFVKISGDVFALRNLGNSNFCGGRTDRGRRDCLSAWYPTISRQTRLIVEERVLKRDISNIRYRLTDSRIYQEKVQELSHAFATNDSTDQESTVTLKYSSTESVTTSYSNTFSVSTTVKTTFVVGFIPKIYEGKIEVGVNPGYTREWGKQETRETAREVNYTVVVPPLTTMKVSLMCTKGACDVPFSYLQTDLLTNGEIVSAIKDDGIFTGLNSYNFYLQSSKMVNDGSRSTWYLDRVFKIE